MWPLLSRRAYIGVDTGNTAATDVIWDDGIQFHDWHGDRLLAAREVRHWSHRFKIGLAALEKTGARPRQKSAVRMPDPNRILRELIYTKSGAIIYQSGMEYKLHKTSQENKTGWPGKKHTEEPG
jgi:hypothetical protein